jgi:hypothetical protein
MGPAISQHGASVLASQSSRSHWLKIITFISGSRWRRWDLFIKCQAEGLSLSCDMAKAQGSRGHWDLEREHGQLYIIALEWLCLFLPLHWLR